MHSRLSTLGVQSLSWVYLSPCSHTSADSRMRLLMLQEQHGEGTSSFGGRRNQTFQWPAISKKKCCHVKASWNPACILPTAARWKSEGAAVENKPVGKAPPKGQTGNFKHTFKSFPFSSPIWFFQGTVWKELDFRGYITSAKASFLCSLCVLSLTEEPDTKNTWQEMTEALVKQVKQVNAESHFEWLSKWVSYKNVLKMKKENRNSRSFQSVDSTGFVGCF